MTSNIFSRRIMMSLIGGIALSGLMPDNANAAGKGARTGSRTHKTSVSQRSMATARSMISHSKKTRGHLTKHHIGRTRSYLQSRAKAPPLQYQFAKARGASAKTLKNLKPRKRKEFSTFKDEKAAQAALARAIDKNRSSLRGMMNAGHTRKTISVPVRGGAGTVLKTKSGAFVKPQRAVFALQRVGRRLVVKTGYLTAQGRKA